MNEHKAREFEMALRRFFEKKTGQKTFKILLGLNGAAAEWRDWNVRGDDFMDETVFAEWQEIFPS